MWQIGEIDHKIDQIDQTDRQDRSRYRSDGSEDGSGRSWCRSDRLHRLII